MTFDRRILNCWFILALNGMQVRNQQCHPVLTPMRVDDKEGAKDGVGHWGGPGERDDERGDLRGRHNLRSAEQRETFEWSV